jgi:hypothetical protein
MGTRFMDRQVEIHGFNEAYWEFCSSFGASALTWGGSPS